MKEAIKDALVQSLNKFTIEFVQTDLLSNSVKMIAHIKDFHNNVCKTNILIGENGISFQERGAKRNYSLTWVELIELALNSSGRSQVGSPDIIWNQMFEQYFQHMRNKNEKQG